MIRKFRFREHKRKCKWMDIVQMKRQNIDTLSAYVCREFVWKSHDLFTSENKSQRNTKCRHIALHYKYVTVNIVR